MMPNDQQIILQSFWDERSNREGDRESSNPQKQVHTDLLRRAISDCIGEQTGLNILDAGGGSGRFSLALAAAGHNVVHLDISQEMLAQALEASQSSGLKNITFVHGSIDDLSQFPDEQFDLVLCLDSPLSYCVNTYEKALNELVRVTSSKLVLCVINRLGIITEGGINFDLQHYGELRTVVEVFDTGTLRVTREMKQLQQTLFPSWHAFRPEEIIGLLEQSGCHVDHLSAPGSLARFVEPNLLKTILENPAAYDHFLNFEETFDSDESVLGVGAAGAGGLLVVATKN